MMVMRNRSVARAVRRLLTNDRRLVLAVSGGIDSMTLLNAVARSRAGKRHVVAATFDHGTGDAATAAAALVASEATRFGIPIHTGRVQLPRGSEAEWRASRWRFLRDVARAECARVVTAHTIDDQVETVFMRVLRGTGVRGLAGLYAESDIARPFIAIRRADVERYARQNGVQWIDDPSNASRAHLRNRVRMDLLPAVRRVCPAFEADLLRLARQASGIRRALDDLARNAIVESATTGALEVDAGILEALPDPGLRLLWQAIMAAGRVALDRRGIIRLAKFTRSGRTGGRIQLSGAIEVVRARSTFSIVSSGSPHARHTVPLGRGARLGAWLFRPVEATTINNDAADPWVAAFGASAELMVRAWEPGDRVEVGFDGSHRRVKRFFADARIPGPLRRGWPVVLLAGKVVWIPGIRRSSVPEPSVKGSLIHYRCERLPG